MTVYQFLRTERHAAALTVTITNPPQNFLNASIVAELSRLMEVVEADDSVRALVITGGVEGHHPLRRRRAGHHLRRRA